MIFGNSSLEKSKFFSVSAGEVIHISMSWEQLGIVFRHVMDGEANEKLVGFVSNCQWGNIFREIKAFIANCGLYINFVVDRSMMVPVQGLGH